MDMDNIDRHRHEREAYRQLNPHPTTPQCRRLPSSNNQNTSPTRLRTPDQQRRALIRASTRKLDDEDDSPRRKRSYPTTRGIPFAPRQAFHVDEDPASNPFWDPLEQHDTPFHLAPLNIPPRSPSPVRSPSPSVHAPRRHNPEPHKSRRGSTQVLDQTQPGVSQLETPPATQPSQPPNARALAQRRRREKERQMRQQHQMDLPTPPLTQRAVEEANLTRRQIAQRQRRRREAEERRTQALQNQASATSENNQSTQDLEIMHARLKALHAQQLLHEQQVRDWREVEEMDRNWRHVEARVRAEQGDQVWEELEHRLQEYRAAREHEEHEERALEEEFRDVEEAGGRTRAERDPRAAGGRRQREATTRRRLEADEAERARLAAEEERQRHEDDNDDVRDGHNQGNNQEEPDNYPGIGEGDSPRLDEQHEQEVQEERERLLQWQRVEGEQHHHERPNPYMHLTGALCAARRPYIEESHTLQDFGRMSVKCPHCDALHWLEERTDGSKISPIFGMCCKKGEVELPPEPEPPAVLRALLEDSSRQAVEFRQNIAQYNAALAFTSVGVRIDEHVNHVGRGQPVFRIHGELKHWSGTLLPAQNRAPSYAQLYILDPQAALQARMQRNDNLDRLTMRQLQNMLADVNPYSRLYVDADEMINNHPESPNFFVRLRLKPGQDRRRYNEPTADEVAVLVPDDENVVPDKRDIILRRRVPERGYTLQRIWETHPGYAPLHYVLLFPYGNHGWHPELSLARTRSTSRTRLTVTRYIAYYLHTRINQFSTILRSGRLFQRFLVDMWAIADQNRLEYLRNNQTTLRAEVYQGLTDALTGGDTDLETVGQKVILPSSYVGGPRYMHQRFQDGMALVRHFKKIDLFITVTANPQWPEIERELLPGQTAYDRPELVARVFKLKKDAIIEDIYKKGIFGKAVAYIYTIEFQKRGLPHMHLLVILQDEYKLRSPDDVDTCIRAYWPDPETEPRLFEIVKKNMVHGPCGDANPTCVCMDHGQCQKDFPKPFQEETSMDERGYPKYRRPNDGRQYKVGRHWVDNSWIVPYCPYLLLKYNCHINVECAATISAVKYTVKYVHKGGDRGSLEVGERDEIKLFLEGRYFSCSEAAWRIFHFDIHDQEPAVIPLQIHLENHHLITFNPNDNRATIANHAAFTETTLTAFFKANAATGDAGAEARKYLYQEFPEHYVFKRANRSQQQPAHWKPRERGYSIGRIYFVPPTGGERFYLRKLLTVIRGPTSFTDLRTVHGVVHSSYRDACIAYGLLSDDQEWRRCLEEASFIKSGRQLRLLFATILLFCQPTKPEELWATFRSDICDDLDYQLSQRGITHTEEDIYDYGLYLLDRILQESGKNLTQFPSMPVYERDWVGVEENPLVAEQLGYDRAVEREQEIEMVGRMNEEQRNAFDTIMSCVR